MTDRPPSPEEESSAPGEQSVGGAMGAAANLPPEDLLFHLQDAVIVTDPGFRIAAWNPAAEALYGWTAAEAIGQPVSDLLETDFLGVAPAQILADFRAQGVWKGEVRQRRRDGRLVPILATVAQILGPAGELRGVVSVNRDISLRAEAEARLRAHAARLEILASASHVFALAGSDESAVLNQVARVASEPLDATCIIRLRSDDGQWLHAVTIYDPDPAVCEAVGTAYRRAPVHIDTPNMSAVAVRTGEPVFVPEVDLEAMRALAPALPDLWPVFERFSPYSVIVTPLRAGEQILGALSFSRHRPGLGAFTPEDLSLAQDLAARAALAVARARLYQQAQRELAERVRAERALEAERALLVRRVAERTADLSLANAELARAARLKDEFLANMSHELRTPLNAILGRAEALQEAIYGPVTPEQLAALESIAESGQHLLALINDILDLAKIEAGQLTLDRESVDVGPLGMVALRMVAQGAMVKRISLSSSFDSAVQRFAGDERRLKQILVNLLSNAVKFTPAGGQVGLEVQGDAEQQSVTFTVWDTGIGIPSEELPRLFQPFVQLDSSLSRQYTGSGLGLALVARLARAHGGSVSVSSTPGLGSRFSVTLPWSDERATPQPGRRPGAAAAGPPAVRRALVLEESPTAAAQTARFLRELGAGVEIHPHAAGALERAIALQPDVIILDLLLPDNDGWTVIGQLKAEPRTRAIPVLVTSVVEAPAAQLSGAALLRKPIDRPALEQALRAALGRRQEPSPPLALLIAPDQRPPRLLLAEDNEETIVALADYLGAQGYDLRVARTGDEALSLVAEEPPDVIVMDVQMPGLSGLEAIRSIRAMPRLAAAPIIAVTALAMPGDRERCLAAGGDEHFAKPVNLRALAVAIEALRRHRAAQGLAADAT